MTDNPFNYWIQYRRERKRRKSLERKLRVIASILSSDETTGRKGIATFCKESRRKLREVQDEVDNANGVIALEPGRLSEVETATTLKGENNG